MAVSSTDRGRAVEQIATATKDLDPDTQRFALETAGRTSDPLGFAQSVTETAPGLKALTSTQARVAGLKAAAGIPPASTQTANDLWRWVVLGLLALLGVALIGLITLLALGKTVDVVVTAFTALLTGTLGLFTPSPTSSGSNG